MNRRLFLHTPLTAASVALLVSSDSAQAGAEVSPSSQDHVFESIYSWLEAVCTRGGKFVRVDLSPDVDRTDISNEHYMRIGAHAKLGLLHVERGDAFWIPLLRVKDDPLKGYLRQWCPTRRGRELFAQRVSEEPAIVLAEAKRARNSMA